MTRVVFTVSAVPRITGPSSFTGTITSPPSVAARYAFLAAVARTLELLGLFRASAFPLDRWGYKKALLQGRGALFIDAAFYEMPSSAASATSSL